MIKGFEKEPNWRLLKTLTQISWLLIDQSNKREIQRCQNQRAGGWADLPLRRWPDDDVPASLEAAWTWSSPEGCRRWSDWLRLSSEDRKLKKKGYLEDTLRWKREASQISGDFQKWRRKEIVGSNKLPVEAAWIMKYTNMVRLDSKVQKRPLGECSKQKT